MDKIFNNFMPSLPSIMDQYIKKPKNVVFFSYDIVPTNFYTITFEGWNRMKFICENSTLNEMLEMSSQSINALIKSKKDTHAFSEPQFGYRPDNGTFFVKIGTIEKDLYKKIMDNRKSQKSKDTK